MFGTASNSPETTMKHCVHLSQQADTGAAQAVSRRLRAEEQNGV
jgi:hypothetical protein